jgi:dihydroxycyclohexadiene carboxylate dehydrogenase
VIVNVSSIATRSLNRVPYAAAKGGVNAITASLAWEVAERGIRVVATAPGGTEAPPRDRAAQPECERRRSGKDWYQTDRRPDDQLQPDEAATERWMNRRG